ncbi:flagellar biosynthesis protein FliQ [Natranaerobius thermophilus]|uniref:Flagellar biosynthetic protein FliQ n=1 Tax=Natranaerobius thermophilus (strain ATCC BAA-1301 / DSM 18059 / JW/NM-WN-LF) TaxID=457570 RepID=B2A363_NATTJ|nr:flagellar biosynthesis protein FliQ [Natranaerobius thermophilus]ACB84993.1 flagellar biosynthetic protein FliQ [Natranaerobius thermophilus JW/NM-WN-LF]
MTEEFVLHLGREALITVLLAAAPMLASALIVGLMVSIFQATTQIQEQTLAFVPKIVAVLLSVAFFGPWMYTLLTEFAINIFSNINQFIN